MRANRAGRLLREARWLLIGLIIGIGVECAICGRILALYDIRQRSWLQRSAWGADGRLWSSSVEKARGAMRVRIAFQRSARPTRPLPNAPPSTTPSQLIDTMVTEQPWMVIPPSLRARATAAAQSGAGEPAPADSGEFFTLALGWPLFAFSGDIYAAEFPGRIHRQVEVEVNCLYVLRRAAQPDSSGGAFSRAQQRGIPLRPIWHGLALNAALFGVLPLTFIRFMVRAPAWLRRRRGRCERCWHQLLEAQTTCPECGLTR